MYNKCVCNPGFTLNVNMNRCIPNNPPPSNCDQNSYDNGLGQCICKPGFIVDPTNNNRCIPSNNCPPYSIPGANPNICDCIPGYKRWNPSSPICSQCPNNQIYLNGQCTITCGVN